jgi:hypothetical protein
VVSTQVVLDADAARGGATGSKGEGMGFADANGCSQVVRQRNAIKIGGGVCRFRFGLTDQRQIGNIRHVCHPSAGSIGLTRSQRR